MEELVRWASATLIDFTYVDEVVMRVHDEFENLSNGQSLRPPVKNSLFEQKVAEKRGMEELVRWVSAA